MWYKKVGQVNPSNYRRCAMVKSSLLAFSALVLLATYSTSTAETWYILPDGTAPPGPPQQPNFTQRTEATTKLKKFGLGGSCSIGIGRSLKIASDDTDIDTAGLIVNLGLHLAWEGLTLGVVLSLDGPDGDVGEDVPGFTYYPLQGWLSYEIYNFAGISWLAVVPAIGIGQGELTIFHPSGEQPIYWDFDYATMDVKEYLVSLSLGYGQSHYRVKKHPNINSNSYFVLTYTYAFTELDNFP